MYVPVIKVEDVCDFSNQVWHTHKWGFSDFLPTFLVCSKCPHLCMQVLSHEDFRQSPLLGFTGKEDLEALQPPIHNARMISFYYFRGFFGYK